MVLEFGDWVFDNGYEGNQTQIFRKTYPALVGNFDTQPGGYVGSAVWWSLDDYWTDVAGIGVERFGLYRPDGSLRPVGAAAKSGFGEVTSPSGTIPGIVSGGVDMQRFSRTSPVTLKPSPLKNDCAPMFVLCTLRHSPVQPSRRAP